MKRQVIVWMLAGLILLPGCGGGDKDKDINKNKDRPVAETPEKKV
jgi:hypothetical protein